MRKVNPMKIMTCTSVNFGYIDASFTLSSWPYPANIAMNCFRGGGGGGVSTTLESETEQEEKRRNEEKRGKTGP
jgi:hypothetical protein